MPTGGRCCCCQSVTPARFCAGQWNSITAPRSVRHVVSPPPAAQIRFHCDGLMVHSTSFQMCWSVFSGSIIKVICFPDSFVIVRR